MPPLSKPVMRSLLVLTLLVSLLGSTDPLTTEAAKKKGGPDPAAQAEAELKKNLDPLNEQLSKLMIKIESRGLLSPDEAGQLADLKYKLLDMMNQFPQNALMAKTVYQAGILFNQREEFNDSYELFNFLAQGFPSNPYGAKAKGQLLLLEKRMGPDYFIKDPGTAPSGSAATPAPTETPPKK